MYSCNFCAVFLSLIFVTSSTVSREYEEENALFYNQRTKNVKYAISKASQTSYEGVNQTFIQRHRRNAQGKKFLHPTHSIWKVSLTCINVSQCVYCVFKIQLEKTRVDEC